jgi:Avidin family
MSLVFIQAIGDIVGFVDDDIISLVVKWRGVSAMTSWVGQIVTQNKKDSLSTLWHLISNTPEEQEEDLAWAAILTGADIFHR